MGPKPIQTRTLRPLPSAHLPGGYEQRLAMAAALLHGPEILFLDEPTSGADPFARREFWQRITALASKGVTVIVTTHFMAEAEYCDRAAILDNGKVLAQGTPSELRTQAPAQAGHTATMEGAWPASGQTCGGAVMTACHESGEWASIPPPRRVTGRPLQSRI